MKICIIGDFSNEKLDEGMKNVAFRIAREFSKKYLVLKLHIGDIFSPKFWKNIKQFNPQIIHYISGPSIFSFIIIWLLRCYSSDAKTIISAVHPRLPGPSKIIVQYLKPDAILVQSERYKELFNGIGITTLFFPNGVDLNRFKPLPTSKKMLLREKYGIDKNKFVILHVGHIKRERNLEILKKLHNEENMILIVGSTSTKIDKKLYNELVEKGCKIMIEYIPKIEEIYALSDCYIFPTMKEQASIEIPLSLLEAMACNLPIITTKFRGIKDIFKEGDGLFFIDKPEEIMNLLHKVKQLKPRDIKNRERIINYSWDKLYPQLEKIYENLLKRRDET